ncbi:DUF4397 domain-containing protein [Streptomyces griseus]|uniref:DUF4397 domain-containing protein n=1 Tax=Streptomyces griseus TaxID=1911 RepID=UPI00380DEEBD
MTLSARRPAALILTTALCAAGLAAPAVAAEGGNAAWSGGWLRLAHFSPGAPTVDVYLYPFGGAKPAMVLKHVAYGSASSYKSVAAGQYTVAMRKAGAATSARPVISSTVRVDENKAYTVAGLGPGSALELRTLTDQLSAPKGSAGVRVIQASLNQPSVTVQLSDEAGSPLRFPASTPYRTVPAGTTAVKVSAGAARTSRTLQLSGRSTHTLVVLSASDAAPKLLKLTDSSGPGTQPKGGVDAGFGGLAGQAEPSSVMSPMLGWIAAVVLGAGAVWFALRRLRHS